MLLHALWSMLLCVEPLTHEFTVDVEHSHVHFLGSLAINLWDLQGELLLPSKRSHL